MLAVRADNQTTIRPEYSVESYMAKATPKIQTKQRQFRHAVSSTEGLMIMKATFIGMFLMTDMTAMLLAAATDSTWEKYFYHSLVGSTLGMMTFGCLYRVTDYMEFARRSVAAIILGISVGPVLTEFISRWLLLEANSVLSVAVATVVSIGGPYAVVKYGQRGVDETVEKFLQHKDDRSGDETPGGQDDDTIKGKR